MSQSGFFIPAVLAVMAFAPGPVAAQDRVVEAGDVPAADAAALPPKIVDRVPIEIDADTLAAAIDTDSLIDDSAAARPLPRRKARGAAAWSKTDNGDGSAKYSVSKPLGAWDASIGADISTAARPASALPATTTDTGAGSAWANLAVPYFAVTEVRAESTQDSERFATRLKRSLPIGDSLSLTAQTSLGVTEMRGPMGDNEATPITASRLFDVDRSMQLDFKTTGTTLLAGATTVTNDPITHNRVTAAQKIYGPLTVTGSLNDIGEATSSKSITAGMNFSW
jgi:hypothetical protein